MLENYKLHENGVIEQIEKGQFVYDTSYVKYYDNFKTNLSKIRLDFIEEVIDRKPTKILDVGYGNGDFIKHCLESNINGMFGSDISNYPIPDGARFVPFEKIFYQWFDVITFFDSLEHFHSLDFLSKLTVNFVVISLPWCHYFSDEWFRTWKHRKPNEHLWHFNPYSLTNLMTNHKFKLIEFSNVEDEVRKPIDDFSNILTAIFKKV